MQDAYNHCERLVREADKDRFLACLFAPAEERRRLLALYAFNLEIARVREMVREALPGELRLQWWHDTLVGRMSGDVAAHPVAAALIDTVDRCRLPVEPLLELIEARRFDLYDEPMQSVAELDEYARKTSSVLFALAGHILAGEEPAVAEAAVPAGIAYAVTGLLRAFAAHAARRRLYIPIEVLDRHKLSSEDVFAAKTTAPLMAALTDMRDHVRANYRAFRACARALPAAAEPAFLPLAIVPPVLTRMDARRSDPFVSSDIPQWRRQWAQWRAAKRGFR